ncbi:Ycf48-like protein [bacterium BMS3Abin03]|nr:Ycf48-like protein [bacterium BMS3Abin03]
MKKFYFIYLALFLLTITLYPQQQNDTTGNTHRNYRRTSDSQPPTSYYQQPKEQVFPLGYGTNHLGKVTTGTGVWTELNPKVPRVDYLGIGFANKDTGWAVGANGALIKTTDGGESWQRVFTPGYTSDYWWIDFLNENYGFIAANGKVLRTTDGGNNWEIIQAGDGYPLFSIDVIDSLHIAAGGYGGTGYPAKNIYSSDGGYSWVINGGSLPMSEINCIKYINIDTGYVVMTYFGLYKTTDRGESWTHLSGIGDYELEIFPEENTGYNAGAGLKIYKAEGNLDVWSKLIINTDFADVYFTTEQKGFAISSGVNGILFKTENGGTDWQVVSGAPGGGDILFLDSLTGFIAGSDSKIYKTTDGGESWYATNGVPNIIAKIDFINSSVGWAAGGFVIIKTTDGGENWETQITLPADHFTSIFMIDSLNGWATSRYVWQTTDGGENWIQILDITSEPYNDVYFTDIDTGFVIESPYLYKTTDSGNTWTTQLNSDYIIRTFGWLSKSHGFIIGDGMYETTDTGSTWNEILELRNVGLRKFQSPTEFLGYSVGNTGLIYKYLDTSYVPVELTSFKGYLKENKIVLEWQTASELNNEGFIIEKSKDKIEWKPIGFAKGYGTTTGKNKYQFYDYNLDNVRNYYRLKQIDYDGTYKFSNIVEISYSITSFNLSQNYPNPFNPSTIIKYSIVKKGEVKLMIYDILGREVSVLVNEVKDPGYYEVNFNASNLASGVYFYRLVAGSFVSTHKMLLLK